MYRSGDPMHAEVCIIFNSIVCRSAERSRDIPLRQSSRLGWVIRDPAGALGVWFAIPAETLDVQGVLQRVIANAELEQPLPERRRYRLVLTGHGFACQLASRFLQRRAISSMSASSSGVCSGLSGSSHSNFFGTGRLKGGMLNPRLRRDTRFPRRTDDRAFLHCVLV